MKAVDKRQKAVKAIKQAGGIAIQNREQQTRTQALELYALENPQQPPGGPATTEVREEPIMQGPVWEASCPASLEYVNTGGEGQGETPSPDDMQEEGKGEMPGPYDTQEGAGQNKKYLCLICMCFKSLSENHMCEATVTKLSTTSWQKK
jgi:hypothetical protein